MNRTIKDIHRDPRVASREARRYRTLLRRLLGAIDGLAPTALSGDPEKMLSAFLMLREIAGRTERAGWPRGTSAGRPKSRKL